MTIKVMIRFLIAFYIFLITLVTYGIYDLNQNTLALDEIRENRYAIIQSYENRNYSASDTITLEETRQMIQTLRKEMDRNIEFIYIIMLLAIISLFFTYRAVYLKVLQPVFEINKIILAYQNDEKNIQEFQTNDDEIGLMIKEFFIMKKLHDADYTQLEKLALTDPLTEILNRRAFFEIAEKILKYSLRNGKHFSILLLDIDYFKKINDIYGHLIGDEVLKYFVQKVSGEIRDSDAFARFGGEEFIIMLPDTDEAGGLALANKIRESIEINPYTDEKLSISFTVSGGLSTLKNEKLLRELIHRADTAVYAAKSNGRNRIEVA